MENKKLQTKKKKLHASINLIYLIREQQGNLPELSLL